MPPQSAEQNFPRLPWEVLDGGKLSGDGLRFVLGDGQVSARKLMSFLCHPIESIKAIGKQRFFLIELISRFLRSR
jgi:hypothetical protein